MSDARLETERQLLEKKKEALRVREALIREKEKKQRFRRCVNIGKLAVKAQIDQLDEDCLLGAFLDIAAKKHETRTLEIWKKKSEEFLNENNEQGEQMLAIQFTSIPNEQQKNQLKHLKFKWNRFRKEYYGRGSRNALEKLLQGNPYRLEVIDA